MIKNGDVLSEKKRKKKEREEKREELERKSLIICIFIKLAYVTMQIKRLIFRLTLGTN